MTFSYTLDRENRHITVEEGATEIPASVFRDSDEFDTVDIPNTVLNVADKAFVNPLLMR